MAASLAIASIALHCLPGTCADQFDIVYPRVTGEADPRAAYVLAVLDLAMRKVHAQYTVRASSEIMERGRALHELGDSSSINLYWTSMGDAAERDLRAVRVPLTRGLLGLRVLVIRGDRQVDFERIDTLNQLRPKLGGQGLGWIDTQILLNAGLQVETSRYDLLFSMVQAGRLDYYPRGVLEAYTELDVRHQSDPDLTVEKHLLLAYRSDWLFFTNKHDEKLAHAIETGLALAYRDGSFQRLFASHPVIQEALKRAGLDTRRMIHLDNPFLSDADRAIPESYWMTH